MKKFGTLIFAAIITSTSSADALCYICNRADWDKADYARKIGFVAGVIAEMTVNFTERPKINRYRDDLSSCVVDLELSPIDLVSIVDQQYENLENWEWSPHKILSIGLRKVCLRHMNRARAARGDEILQ